MKKLSDCIKLIKRYKKQKRNLIKDVAFDTVVSVLSAFLIFVTFWSMANLSIIFLISFIETSIIFGLNMCVTNNDLAELKELKKNYKDSFEIAKAFTRELKAKGIKLSKDSLVKSNVHANKKVNDMKIITAVLDDSKKEIRIIEEPKESSIMTVNNGLSVIPSPKEIDENVYYVDKDLVIDELEEKDDFKGNARSKGRRF